MYVHDLPDKNIVNPITKEKARRKRCTFPLHFNKRENIELSEEMLLFTDRLGNIM